MPRIFSQLITNQKISLALIWILLWIIPWGKWLFLETNLYITFVLGFLCLGVALILLITPGALLYISLSKKSDEFFYLGIVPVGFAFSVTLIGLIGLLGRYFGFSFDTVKFLFFLMGFILILNPLSKNTIKLSEIIAFTQNLFLNPILIVAICLAFALTISDLLFFIDDLTYLAYLTNWQHAQQLGFQNIIHEPVVIELERFWLAMYPMGQAILSDLSGVPGILLFSNYLELLFVPLAVVTAYWFACQLGFSRNAAAISVLIQVSLYAWLIGDEWPIGTWFYQSMAEDKVSAVFFLAPVFFVYVIKYTESASWKYLMLAFFSGLAITLTHPVSLFFSCVLALWLAILSFLFRKENLNQLIIVAVLVIILMSPYLLIRLIDFSSQAGFVAGTAQSGGGAYQIDRYTNVISNTFYGMNPRMLLFVDLELGGVFNAFRFFPVVIGLLTLIVSFTQLRKGKLYWYVFSSALLVLLVAIPYTGWIFGYFTDARLIYRASWFAPLGLGSVIILQSISSRLKNFKIYSKRNNLILLFCFLFTLPVFAFMNLPRIPKFFEVLDRNIQLANIGSEIDLLSEHQVVSIGLDYVETMLLPGVSAKTMLISFREEKLDNGHNHYLTEAEIEERIYASGVIRSLATDEETNQERCAFINKYNVEFVIADNTNANLYLELIRKCGIVAEKKYQTKDKTLLQIQVAGQE
ncbi:MAG: hypothetical protein JNK81_03055 [Anaerolineales bacterium]|nr:hypothetical protein [Anaerolineales bacterium]